MGHKANSRAFISRNGFTIAEVLIALFFVTTALVLVAGLGQQVMNLAKKSSQTGAILELRNMTNAITRNSENWLTAMRSSQHTQGIYAGCIPDPKTNIATFNCPTTSAAYLSDPDLREISENGTYHIASVPLVNSSGDLVAGSDTAPVFYTTEGRVCKANNTADCSLKSTGYFLRSNSNTSQDPGSIKFVIKVERNVANVASASSPMKPQYITMDMGNEWKNLSASFSGSCPANTIKVGYLSNGKPSCINPAKPCADSNQIPIGLMADGTSICKALPNCVASGGHVVLNQTGDDLICSTSSPCGENKLFLGYFAGSGEPMCSSSSMKCPSGQVQTGISIAAGNMKAECETLPTCADANQRLSFNGVKFVCETSTVAISCAPEKVMTGINADGSPNCIDRAPASITTVSSASSSSVPKENNSSGNGRTECPTGYSLVGTAGDASAYCISTTRRAPALVDDAITDCENDTPKARLCTPDEWYTACRSKDTLTPAITETMFGAGAKVEFLSIAPGSKAAYGGSHYLADNSCSSGYTDCSNPPDACYSHSAHHVRHYNVKVGYRCCLK